MSLPQFLHHFRSFLPPGIQGHLRNACPLRVSATHHSLRYNSTTTQEIAPQLSYAHGASRVQLLGYTINEALDRAVEKHPSREAFVFPKANVRFTFAQFAQQVGIVLLNLIFQAVRGA